MLDAAAWKQRSIYQVLTDRFATTDRVGLNATYDTHDRKYFGGTWKGLTSKLDYIQGMGFDAVWISPIVKNIEEMTRWGEGYHGYWQEDIYSVNSHYGTTDDLLTLSDSLRARGMYLMVDVVCNHMASTADVDYSRYIPFDNESYYHPRTIITDYDNQTQSEEGWLGDANVPLPDLDPLNPTVARTLAWYIKALVQKFNIDGLRLDTVKHVAKSFWPGFVLASGVFCMGEVLSGNPDYLASYQSSVGGLLDYGTYYPLKRAFHRDGGSMYELTALLKPDYREKFPDVQQLGAFMENHDQARFPHDTNNDTSIVKNALAWTMLTDGIPVVYYGQEQGFTGDGDPGSREVMWTSGYKKTPLYNYIAVLNAIRKVSWNAGFGSHLAISLGNDDNTAATQKGPLLMVLSNTGSKAKPKQLTIKSAYPPGTILVNVLTKQSISVSRNSSISVSIIEGQPQLFLPLLLAVQIADGIIPPLIKKRQKIFSIFNASASLSSGGDDQKTSWQVGVAANTRNILLPPQWTKPNATSRSNATLGEGKILYPKPASKEDKYSIFGDSIPYEDGRASRFRL